MPQLRRGVCKTRKHEADPDWFRKSGIFSVAQASVRGDLRIAAQDTSLYLWGDAEFDPEMNVDRCITGSLHDLTKVTLIDCVTVNSGSHSIGGEMSHFVEVFPHFVLEGRQHLGPSDNCIIEIRVVLEDATALFCDFDAFGTARDAASHIEALIGTRQLGRPVTIGSRPEIAYYTGKYEIIDVDTVFGKVQARHNISQSSGGPNGVWIDNSVSLSIALDPPVSFNEAVSRLNRLLRFLEIVIGRPQRLLDTRVYSKGWGPDSLKVHWSFPPHPDYGAPGGRRAPHPADLLLDPIHRPEEFSNVMRAWLEKDEDREDARWRFHSSFKRQRRYSVDRLIGAANMFDILPASAVPRDVELSSELRAAKDDARKSFECLPHSYERDSVLNALGRVGKASLKQKVRHRADFILKDAGERFPDIIKVVELAVDCRNHYVHGSTARIDYSKHPDLLNFFTDTLEFVFAASEFLEAGWDVRHFIEKGTTMSHPFGAYRVRYMEELDALKAVVGSWEA